jgi:hypothetical protein
LIYPKANLSNKFLILNKNGLKAIDIL